MLINLNDMFERDKRYVYQAQTYRLSKTSEITVKGVKTLCVTCDSVTCHKLSY